MPFSLSRLLSVTRKEVRQVRRDRRMLFVILIGPVIQLLLFGYAATFDLTAAPIAIVDEDRSPQSRRLAAALDPGTPEPGELRVVGRAPRDAVGELFARDDARAVVVIPAGFGREVREGRRPAVATWIDGSDSNTATAVRASLEQTLAREAVAQATRRSGPSAGPPLELRTRVLYNPRLRSDLFMVPGVTAVVLLVATLMLSALSIVKEREAGTFELLYATPIRPVELVVGKLLPFATLGLIDVALILTAATVWFGVPVRGDPALLAAFAFVFVVGSVGLGLLVSTFARTQRQAMVIAFCLLIPMLLLSGFIFPVDAMPPAFQAASRALPVRYFLEAVRAICLRGAGVELLAGHLATVSALSAGVLTVAVLRFGKQL